MRESRMKRKTFFISLISALLLYSNVNSFHSESPQVSKDQKAFQYEVTVVLKLVQVYVTDKKGIPVKDLTKDDFVLYDNGKLQTITDFEEHILAQPSKKVKKEVIEEVKEVEPSPTPMPSSRMNRKFLLLLDLFQTDMAGIQRSKTAALHFIDTQLQPTDEVGALFYSQNQGLILNEYLTTDHQKVRDAIQKIKSVPGRIYDPFERADLTEEEKEFKKMRALQFAKDMTEFAKSLRYIPGIKNVILFSGGISRTILYDKEAEGDALGIPKTNPALREAYDELSKELASSNTPVYAVNTIGTRQQLLEMRGGEMDELGDHSLKMLSDLSGGQYFGDVTTYEAIAEKIQNVTSNYYVLGYYIDEKWDGKYHYIKVEVKQKRCEVHAQKGYFNPKPFTEFSEFEKKFHLMDLALSESPYFQEPLRFLLISLPCSNEKESNLVLISEIPAEKIKETMTGKKEVVTLVFNEENAVVESTRGEIDFAAIPQKSIYHYSILSLSPGKYKCRVVIRELETGKGAVASTSVSIPESLDSGIRIYTPLLLIPEKKATYIGITKASKEKTESEYSSLANTYYFLSNKNSPLLDELDRGTSTLLGIVLCSIFNIQEPEVDLIANLIDQASYEKIPLTFSIISAKSKEEIDILLIELQLPELQPGKYSLEIIAEEITSNSSSKASRTFIVK